MSPEGHLSLVSENTLLSSEMQHEFISTPQCLDDEARILRVFYHVFKMWFINMLPTLCMAKILHITMSYHTSISSGFMCL